MNITTSNNVWNVLFNQFPTLRDEINLFQNNPDIDYHSALRQFSNNFNTSNTSSNISANYNNIYNKYDLTIYSTSQQLSNTFNKIFNSNLINLNNAEKAFTDSSNYTYNTSNIINLSINNQLELKQNNLTETTNLLGIGSSITQLDWNKITLNKPDLTLYNSWTKSDNNIYNTITSGNVGIGNTDPLHKLDVNGSINSTSLYQNGSLIDFANFATDSELTNGLALKQNNLTETTNLVGIGSNITNLDYNKITLNKPSTFPADMTNIYNKTEINTLLNAIQNTQTAETFTPNMSNLYNKTEIDSITSNLYSIDIYERQYPPKRFNMSTFDALNSGEILNVNPSTNYVKGTITLTTSEINYGSGNYIIYSSSTLEANYYTWIKQELFNYNLNGEDFNGGAHWEKLYKENDGSYSGTNYIKSDYLGEWIIIKLPIAIFLSRFIIYLSGTSYTNNRCCASWKCYGSSDGIHYDEIQAGEQKRQLTFSDFTPNSSYTKIVSNCNKAYQYIGFTFSKIIGGISDNSTLTYMNFAELQLFGREQVQPYYTSLNVFNSTLTNYSKTGDDTNYVLKTGSTMSGDLNVLGNLKEAGTNLSSKYALITDMNSLIPATAVNLTAGNKTINGNLTITNDIYLSFGQYLYFDTNSIHSSYDSIIINYGETLYFVSNDIGPLDTYITNGFFHGYGFNNVSDKRIKYDINIFNDSNLMEKFLSLKLTTFKYISKNNSINHLGFIAQEVEKIFPNSVSYGKEFIPNINKNVDCSNNQLIFTPDFDISFLNVDDLLLVEDKRVNIIKIENNIITINESFNKSSVFVYGTQVNDFRSIDKTYLYSINILATQELIRINKEQKGIIENQQKRIESIENELQLIKSKLGI